MKFYRASILIVTLFVLGSLGCKNEHAKEKVHAEGPNDIIQRKEVKKQDDVKKTEVAPMKKGEGMKGMGMGHMHKGMKMPMRFQAVPMSEAKIVQDGEGKLFCSGCGMTLPMFYKTNHAAKVDGKETQFCSIYCLVEAMNSGAKVSDVKVVDNTTKDFIDAEKAVYVVGSSKPPTMAAKISKYAFGKKDAADAFAKEFGGDVMDYKATLELAKKDFETDAKQKNMRQAKAAEKGKMIFDTKCKKIEEKFKSVAQAKAFLKKNETCEGLNGMQLQQVSLFLLHK